MDHSLFALAVAVISKLLERMPKGIFFAGAGMFMCQRICRLFGKTDVQQDECAP